MAVVAGLLLAGLVTVVPSSALADTAPAAGVPETLTADPQPTWQTNGVVWSVEHVGGVVYVGGSFTKVRPPGTAAGSAQEVARRNLAAFNVATGALLPFAHDVRAPEFTPAPGTTADWTCQAGSTAGSYTCDTVYEIKASPDGKTIYVGGDFNSIDGKTRDKVAAFDTTTGALSTVFKPGVFGRVRALAVTSSTLYVGGHFTGVAGGTRTRLAAFNRADGALLPWAPNADAPVLAMVMAPDNSRVVIGGMFDTVNGVAIRGLAAVDAVSGANTRWDSRPIPRFSSTEYSYVTDLIADQDTVYASANGEGWHVFDGRVAADPYTGILRWTDNCLGATWSLALLSGILYSGSHAHNCSSTQGGFPEAFNGILPENQRYYRLLSETARTGQPTILHWFPTTNGGIGGSLGPRTMATDGRYLWVGGEFTTVNGVAQQGLTRFTYHSISPDVGRPLTPAPVAASSTQAGKVTVRFTGTDDLDNTHLTYELIRDGNTAAPIYTVEADSKPWAYPEFTYVDTGLAPGTTHSYDVRATDPWGNRSFRSTAVTVPVASSDFSYPQTVLADGANTYWRFGETSGTTAADSSSAGNSGTYGSGVTLGRASGVGTEPGDAAISVDGSANGAVRASQQLVDPQRFSIELWFRTTTTNGGKLVGFGNSNTGASSQYDRHVYMTNDGHLVYGVWTGSATTAVSAGTYNDGRWHHLVATMGTAGMKLYLDGTLAASNPNSVAEHYNGYWLVGGDNLNGWPFGPNSHYLQGEVDDFSAYAYALTDSDVSWHYDAGTP